MAKAKIKLPRAAFANVRIVISRSFPDAVFLSKTSSGGRGCRRGKGAKRAAGRTLAASNNLRDRSLLLSFGNCVFCKHDGYGRIAATPLWSMSTGKVDLRQRPGLSRLS